MRIVEVNSNQKETIDLINSSSDNDALKSFIANNPDDNNSIYACIIGLDDNTIKNYSMYIGTKDTRLVQMLTKDLSSRSFLEKSIDYAFKNLDAYTITIFADKENKLLEAEGFENLGEENNLITYIKEKEIDKEIGRVRV